MPAETIEKGKTYSVISDSDNHFEKGDIVVALEYSINSIFSLAFCVLAELYNPEITEAENYDVDFIQAFYPEELEEH